MIDDGGSMVMLRTQYSVARQEEESRAKKKKKKSLSECNCKKSGGGPEKEWSTGDGRTAVGIVWLESCLARKGKKTSHSIRLDPCGRYKSTENSRMVRFALSGQWTVGNGRWAGLARWIRGSRGSSVGFNEKKGGLGMLAAAGIGLFTLYFISYCLTVAAAATWSSAVAHCTQFTRRPAPPKKHLIATTSPDRC